MTESRARAAFLDRDGTLNEKPPDGEYLTVSEGFHWLPGACEGLAALARAGFVLTVVSNQRGIARGLVSHETLRQIEQRIQSDLAPHQIAAFRYCPHELNDPDCDCRKPKPGMILALAAERELDLPSSWMIGDSQSDADAGKAAGTHTALIAQSGHADILASSLLAVAEAIVRHDDPVSANSATSAS